MADITGNAQTDTLIKLLGQGDSDDYSDGPGFSMVCTAWNPTTRENVVSDGAVTYTNLLCINPAGMSTGRVLCLRTGGRPVVLGPLFGPTV